MNNRFKTTLAITTLVALANIQADSSDVVEKSNEISQASVQQIKTEATSQLAEQNNSKERHTHFFDDIFEEFEHSMKRMRDWHAGIADSYKNFEAKFLETEKIQAPATTAEIKDEENQVSVFLTVGDEKLALDPKSVDITTRDNQVHGTIVIPNSNIDFTITPNGFYVTKKIEIKDEAKKDDQTINNFIHYSSSSLSRTLPATVDLTSIKAEVKGNSLIITLGKKQYAKVPVTIATSK